MHDHTPERQGNTSPFSSAAREGTFEKKAAPPVHCITLFRFPPLSRKRACVRVGNDAVRAYYIDTVGLTQAQKVAVHVRAADASFPDSVPFSRLSLCCFSCVCVCVCVCVLSSFDIVSSLDFASALVLLLLCACRETALSVFLCLVLRARLCKIVCSCEAVLLLSLLSTLSLSLVICRRHYTNSLF